MKIEVYLNTKMFRRFSNFDTLKRRKAWKAPVTFATILTTAAVICFIMNHVEGAIFLGTVLLVVAWGMPATYFLSFFLSVNKQAKTMGLDRAKLVYTLEIDPKSKMFSVDNGREHIDVKWGDIHRIYRDTVAAYLYVTPQRAFILPYSCMDDPTGTFWPLVKTKLPQEKITDLR